APIQLDTASTMLTSWIGETILTTQRDPAESLDRLTTELARQAREKTLATMATQTPPDMKATMPSGLARAMDQFAAEKNPLGQALGEALEAVRQVMTLAGKGFCQDEVPATSVPLTLPFGVAAAQDGSLVLGFEISGAVIRVRPDGKLQQLFGPCTPRDPKLNARTAFERLFVGPDERVYLASEFGRMVYRCKIDGSERERLVGGGEALPEPNMPGQQAKLNDLTAIAPARAGGFWLAEKHHQPNEGYRLWRVSLDGVLQAPEQGPRPNGESLVIRSVGETPDGALWVLANGRLWRKAPAADWGEITFPNQRYNRQRSTLLPEPDNSVLVTTADKTERLHHTLMRIRPDGSHERFAGQGPAGLDEAPVERLQARFNSPSYLARRPDGRLLVTDFDNGLVRQIDLQGQVTTVLGSRAAQRELAREAALNIPGGVTFDSQGRPVLVETGGHSVRRLQAGLLSRIAGGQAGRLGWNGRVPATHLDGPISIAAVGGDFFITEMNARRLSRLYVKNELELELEVVAGHPDDTRARWNDSAPMLAREVSFREVSAVTATPQGLPVFSAVMDGTGPDGQPVRFSALWRVEANGVLTHLAGAIDAKASLAPLTDSVGARSVRLGAAYGLVITPEGRIVFSDLRRNQVLSLNPDSTLTPVVGNGILKSALAINSGSVVQEREVAPLEASLMVPAGLALDRAGRLYVSELGTQGLEQFSESSGFNLKEVIPPGMQLQEFGGRIRRLDADGKLRVLAGLGAPGSDGNPLSPISLAIAADGRQLVFVDLLASQLKELVLEP
ncbi:MAG: hypothetical protein VKP62_13490, partial [Candidatus Sericytochromatia bacterium]|nr:hypothetical protein [Candidatus Sericytochromatia bacterium]